MLQRSLLAAGLLLGVTALHAPAHASAFDTAVMNTPGLLGYYPFTPASQANSTVNNYTGTLYNGATIGGPGSGPPVNDPNSSALVLNNGPSGTAYASAGGSNPLLGGVGNSGSIIAWINLASLPSVQNRIFSVAGESQSGNDFDLQVNPDNRITFYTDGGGNTATDPLTAANLGNWIFVVATFAENSQRNIYLNGSLAASTVPGGHSFNSSPFYQGESDVFTGRYFDGSLADVGLFNTALTGEQVETLYAASFAETPTAVPEPGTLLLTLGALAAATATRRRPSSAQT